MSKRNDEARRKSDDSPLYVTAEGLSKLKGRLAHLKKILPELINEVARTAAYGDRSENAEYKEAKYLLNRTNGQIFNLEHRLNRAVLLERGPDANLGVRLGSVVQVETEGRRLSFQIVGPNETNPSRGLISHKSPLGEALLGRKRGEIVEIQTISGGVAYKIIAIG